MLTDNLQDVIQTIKSRSQMLHLKEVDENTLKETLIEQGLEEDVATLAPYLTKDLEKALLLAEDPNFIAMVEFIEEIVKNWDNRNVSFPVLFIKKLG